MKVGLSEGKGHPTQALDSSLPLDTEPLTVGMNCADSEERLPNHEAALPGLRTHHSAACRRQLHPRCPPSLRPLSLQPSPPRPPCSHSAGRGGWKQQKQNAAFSLSDPGTMLGAAEPTASQ